jgi:beta-barrel assembly-enhancing protease
MHLLRCLGVGVVTAAALACCGPKYTGPKLDRATVAAERERQHELYRLQFINEYRRVTRTAWPILVAGAELCAERSDVALRLPFDLGSAAWLVRESRRVAPNLAVGEDAMVVAAFEPTAPGGVRDGDIILAVNGVAAPRGATAAKESEQLILAASGTATKPVQLRVRRGGEIAETEVQPSRACSYAVDIKDKREVNAYADGKRVVVMTELLRYLPDDGDLAVILGHEIGHNVRGHVSARKTNVLIGRLLAGGIALPAPAWNANDRQWAMLNSQGFEKEADYVGLYLTARAGYPVDDAPNVWRRMPMQNPGAIDLATTHPSTPERFLALQATVTEIKRKQVAGEKLLPEEH